MKKINIKNPGNYGLEEFHGIYPCNPSQYIEWSHEPSDIGVWVDCWDGVLTSTHKTKIAVVMEPMSLCPHNYEFIINHEDQFDLIYVTYPEFKDKLKNPNKIKYYEGGCRSFIHPEQRNIYSKTLNICSIVSHKNILPGHNLRHAIKNHQIANNFNFIDYVNPPMDDKAMGLKDYRFELIIENEDSPFFSEKLIDSMLCGCIPIYWNSNNLDYLSKFDLDGIVFFKDKDELYNLLNSNYFTQELYESKLEAVKYNFDKAKEFISFGDVLWHAGLKDFLNLTH